MGEGSQHPRLSGTRIAAEELAKGFSALESTRSLGKVMTAFLGVEREVNGSRSRQCMIWLEMRSQQWLAKTNTVTPKGYSTIPGGHQHHSRSESC